MRSSRLTDTTECAVAAVALVPSFLPSLRKVSFSGRILIDVADAPGVPEKGRRFRGGEGEDLVVGAEGEAEGAQDRAASEVSF